MGVFESTEERILWHRIAEHWRVIVFSLSWTILQFTLAVREILPMSNLFVVNVVFPVGFSVIGATIIAWEIFRLIALTRLSTYTECMFVKEGEGCLLELQVHIVNSRRLLWCDWQTVGGHIMLSIKGIGEDKIIQIPPDECDRDARRDVIIDMVCKLTPAETDKIISRITFPSLPTIHIAQCCIMLQVRTLVRWVKKTIRGKEANIAIVGRFE